MKKIITLGETVFDIIFYNFFPKTGNPGGSMLNTSISLGRLGLPVFFISELGDDKTAQHVLKFLEENNIKTQYIECYNGKKTAIALAHLDENRSATYTFYKDYPEKRFAFEFPKIEKNDILLFGSSLALQEGIHERILNYVKDAHEKGAIVIYDPNYRPNPNHEKNKHVNIIEKYLPYTTLLKASDYDCLSLWDLPSGSETFKYITERGCNALFYTKGSKGSELHLKGFTLKEKAKPLETLISTIGAGDNYSAGLIYSLYNDDISNTYKHIMKNGRQILRTATMFSAHVCESEENYISKEFANTYQH